MIIYNILFYIKCVETLSLLYDKAKNTIEQKTISDMVKIWLFYNSLSRPFWTGMTSEEAIKVDKKVKEHEFSNLSSAKYMLSKDIKMHNPRFCDLSKINKICEVIKFMQWNYTISSENQKLKQEQEYEKFYTFHSGDPANAYKEARITLTGKRSDLVEKLSEFLKQEHKFIIEIKLKKNFFRFKTSYKYLMLSDTNYIFISEDTSDVTVKNIVDDIIKNISNNIIKDNQEENNSTCQYNLNFLKNQLKILNGSISIYEKGFEKSYFEFINNDRTTANSF